MDNNKKNKDILTKQTEGHKITFMLKDRKEKAYYRTTLYLDYELARKLKDLAHSQNTTLTELINEALREYLQKQEQEQGSEQEPQEPAKEPQPTQEQEPTPKRRKK